MDSGVGAETLDDFSTLVSPVLEGVPNHLQLGEHLLSDAALVPIQEKVGRGVSCLLPQYPLRA